jgi:Uma2 family endonuclease
VSAVLNPPAVKLLTAAEFAANFSHLRMELVRGVPVETPMPDQRHGKACVKMARYLDEFAEANDLGHVMGNDTFVKVATNPDTIRGGDVLFASYERLPRGPIPPGVLDVIPELVVEVVSPSNLWTGLFTKVDEYLAAGVKVVVILDGDSQTASTYRPNVVQEIFRVTDTLTLPDVLPGFSVPVAKLFG